MTKTFCDGCGAALGVGAGHPAAALTGDRASHMGGGGMPSGRFHLCGDCGSYAFRALRERREARTLKPGGTT